MPKFKNKPNLGKGSNDGAANRQIKARELKKQHNNQPIKIGMKIIATKAKEKLPATKRNCNRQIEPPTISKEYYRYNVTIMGTNPILNINNNDNSNELI
jgi:hypothetical protein